MRITKVYTRTGDAGQTRLAGGQQVWKDSLRVEAYGTVDELNASLGVVYAANAELALTHPHARRLANELLWMQHKLFDVSVRTSDEIHLLIPADVFDRFDDRVVELTPSGG